MTRRLVWLPMLAVCAAVSLADGTAAQEERDDSGAIAVLRRDGVIFPFASFKRDFWQIAWPLSFRDIKLPATLNDIPKKWWGEGALDGWRAHVGPGNGVPITIRALGSFRPFCVDRLGLATTYKSAEAPPPGATRPYPKDGIAVRGNMSIDPIEIVDPRSAEARALEERLLKEFNQVEDRTVQQVSIGTGWRHSFEADERRARPIRIESWYRSPSSEPGWTVSYIEASRTYPVRPEDRGCGLETFVSGWIHHNRGELERASDLRGKLTYCDRVGVVYMLPFGRIRPRTRDYWIFQLSGWSDEWYDVAEVGRERVRYVIEVNAGGCRF